MANYTLNKGGTSFKYAGTEESAKMLASSGGYSISELPTFTPYTAQQINTKISSNVGKEGASTPNPTITAEELTTQQAINVPTYQAPVVPTITIPEYKAPEKTTTTEPDWFSKYMTDLKTVTPVNTVDLYNKAYQTSGLDTLTSDLTSKQTATTEAQKQLDLLQAKLTGITSEGQQAQLTLESQAGTGKDVTGTFLGRKQQEISRQSAIKALPVQAEVLAAQAKVASAQGDVTTAQNAIALAQDKLNTAFKVQTDYAQSVYDYNKELRATLYDYATKKEQQQLDAQNKADEQAFELYKNNIANAQSIAKTAMENGQADIASKITSLDPNSATYTQEVADLQKGIVDKTADLDKQLKQIQIKKAQQDLITTKETGKIVKINGVDYIQNADGTLTLPELPKGTVDTSGNDKNISTINDLLKNKAISSVVGPNILARFGYGSLTGANQNFISSVEQIVSQLSLQSLIDAKAKGATFGALSDREMNILANAATKIGGWAIKDSNGKVKGYNVSENDFKNELKVIQDMAEKDKQSKLGASSTKSYSDTVKEALINSSGTSLQSYLDSI